MKFSYAADAKPVDGFTIRRGIHRGGFGEVYYAVSDAGKEVALKLLTHDFDTELRGIRQCLNLKHPNLVTIFDVKTDHEGDHWVVMEFVRGSNLEEVLTAFPHGLPLSEVHDWMQGIVNGVDYLHDRGLIHRDLKPANIYRENGVVKIGDVGLSKRFDGERRNQHTESIGTVYYMAPEITHGKYGPAIDVYSLGIILYELLTGKLPFNGETSGEILMKQLSAAPDLSAVAPNLRPVLAHALEKDPQQRTSSARQLMVEFENAISGPTEIPESHFVNGHNFSDASQQRGFKNNNQRETSTPRKTDRTHVNNANHVGSLPYEAGRLVGAIVKPLRTQPVTTPPPRGSESTGFHSGFFLFKIVLVALVGLLVLSSIPWVRTAPNSIPDASFISQMPWVSQMLVCVLGVGLFVFLLKPDRYCSATAYSRIFIPSRSDIAAVFFRGAVASFIFTAVPLVVLANQYGRYNPLVVADRLVYLVAVAVLGTWLILGTNWYFRNSDLLVRHPRTCYALMGLILATVAYGLKEYLFIDLAIDLRLNQGHAMVDRFGVNSLVESGQLTWLGFAVFFVGLFFLLGKRLEKAQALTRSVRWKWRHPVIAGLWAWGVVTVFAFCQPVGILWAVAIMASVQLAAPWQPNINRNR